MPIHNIFCRYDDSTNIQTFDKKILTWVIKNMYFYWIKSLVIENHVLEYILIQRAHVLKLFIVINYTVDQWLRRTKFSTSQCKNKERVK